MTIDFFRTTFRVRGDVLDIYPAYEEDLALRVEFFGDEIERLSEIDPLTGHVLRRVDQIVLYPGSHHVTPEEVRADAIEKIKSELTHRIEFFEGEKRLIESQRIRERTQYDLEMIKEIGFCKGIENYSRHFSPRLAGEPAPCLFDYFPEDYLLIVDESHQTIPQIHAMYNGDRARKQSLIDFGFRLPSAYDNRPLQFSEWYQKNKQVVYVSATPAIWEVAEAEGIVVEQVVRPTGLLDPVIEIRPAEGQVDDCLAEIREHVAKGGRVLVTTLTKRLSEDLTTYLTELNVKAKYLHSDIDTLERMQILQDLRLGKFDVLVGINLLREGLDLPEVSLVAILDADKEGFLRSETSLIQTCGRAARNSEGRVIMYADKQTTAIVKTLAVTEQRRALQIEYNAKHGITPTTIKRAISPLMAEVEEVADLKTSNKRPKHGKKGQYGELQAAEASHPYMTPEEVRQRIAEYEVEMKRAAKELRFEDAAHFRDLMRQFETLALTLG